MTEEARTLETRETPFYSAYLRSDGIVHFVVKEIKDYSIEMVKSQDDLLKEFGQGKALPVILSFTKFIHQNDETNKYAATKGNLKHTKAIALVVPSVALRLGGNFYLTFFKPKISTRIFNSEPDATKWLRKFI